MSKKSEEPSIIKLKDKRDEDFIPTGIKEIDSLITGIARGRITEIWGKEGVGKTDLVTRLMANISQDKKILYVDTEFALNKDRVIALGVNPKNVQYLADSRLERVCELLISSVGKYDLIILDSLAYLTPLTVESSDVGENAIGLYSRLIKHWIVKFRPKLGDSSTAFVVINQYRKSINMYDRVEPPGGTSWHHAVDVRLLLSTNSADKITKAGEITGHKVHVEIKKSKLSTPHKKTTYILKYNKDLEQ